MMGSTDMEALEHHDEPISPQTAKAWEDGAIAEREARMFDVGNRACPGCHAEGRCLRPAACEHEAHGARRQLEAV